MATKKKRQITQASETRGSLIPSLFSRKQTLRDTSQNTVEQRETFKVYTKDDLLSYLKAPDANAERLVSASRKIALSSTHYGRLLWYHATTPLWVWYLSFRDYSDSATDEHLTRAYERASKYVGRMALDCEGVTMLYATLRDGAYFGVINEDSNTWFTQMIDPKICEFTGRAEGCWLFSVDMSKIKKEDLYKYPAEFTTMYEAYEQTGVRLQEVPEKITFTLKADETCRYVVPPYSSLLPYVFDLENAVETASGASENDKYKMLSFTVPRDGQGKPTMLYDDMLKYYNHLAKNLPDGISLAMTPTSLSDINFEKSGMTDKMKEIYTAIQNFWYNAGVSGLLMGDVMNASSASLSLSTKTDEAISARLQKQVEKNINRLLSNLAGSPKMRITIYPCSLFSIDKAINWAKDALAFGLPVKQLYASLLSVRPVDVAGACRLENGILGLDKSFIPPQTSYTQTDKGGRPPSSAEDITGDGERERERQGGEA